MSHPIRQHYIPRVYLKNFTDENNRIWVYDKQEKTFKYLSLKDTTVVKNLYTIVDAEGNKDFSIEELFGKNENRIASILSKIVKQEQITLEDKYQFSLFIALLNNRTLYAIEKNTHITTDILTWIKDRMLDLGIFDDLYSQTNLSRENAKEIMQNVKIRLSKPNNLKMLIRIANDIASVYQTMEWKIWNIQESNFLTSDNPSFLFSNTVKNSIGFGILNPEVLTIISLSSKQVLIIRNSGRTSVHYVYCENKQQTSNLNILTYSNAKRFVIANNKGLLENIVEKGNLC